jgi:hypothetical protein
MSMFATERAPATTTHSVAARLDRIPPFSLHRRMCVAVGFANFFDLYDIFLGGVLAAVLAEQWGSGRAARHSSSRPDSQACSSARPCSGRWPTGSGAARRSC